MDDLLRLTLATGVPIAMFDLALQGGPLEGDWARARAFALPLAAHGDDILFRSKRPGVTADLVAQLIRAVAVLAYAPGGVTTFGLHFDAGQPDAEGAICCRSMGKETT